MIPTLDAVDSFPALMREGYTFVSRRCDRLHSDAFLTRFVGRPTYCVRGADAGRMFYGDGRMTRQGALPRRIRYLLQDDESVQSLDAEAHRRRKQIYMATLVHGDRQGLVDLFTREWLSSIGRWRNQGRVTLHAEAQAMLTRANLEWCGIPYTESDVSLRLAELRAMVEQVGSFGPPNWWARHLRNRCERWGQDLIRRVRSGEIRPPAGTVLDAVVSHRDDDGQQLSPKIGAIELINVLRPVLAVGLFVDYCALALLREPQWRERFAAGDEADLRPFVQEVRRFYPFFPTMTGRVREPFSWHDHDFAPGERVFFDIYGTNHDPRSFPEPEAFRPGRFSGVEPDPFGLVPQGGGFYEENHRCPGEPVTIELMEQSVRLLTRSMHYRVPAQNLAVGLNHAPTGPADGMILADIEPTGAITPPSLSPGGGD